MAGWLHVLAVLALVTAPLACGVCAAAAQEPPRPDAAAQVAAWMRDQRAGGVVVVLVDPAGARFYARGTHGERDPQPLGPDSIVELGGLTQPFVALLWAQLVLDGTIERDAALGDLWRDVPWPPGRGAWRLPLTSLLTHTAGLPARPPVLTPTGALPAADQPYAQVDAALLRAFFASWRPEDDGARPAYAASDLGYAAVAAALQERLGEPLAWVLGPRVLEPLGMGSTAFALGPGMDTRLASGHRQRLPVRPLEWNALRGAGGLLGSARDLGEFLRFTAGLRDGPRDALRLTAQPLHLAGSPEVQAAPGWLVRIDPAEGPFVFQRGDTPGYSSFLGFNTARRVGVAVVSNSDRRVDPLAVSLYRWLLDNARQPEE